MTGFLRKLLWLLIPLTAWGVGLMWFGAHIPAKQAEGLKTAQAIVILTGSRGRLDYGLSLFAESLAPRLFISGVAKGARVHELLAQTTIGVRERMTPEKVTRIELGDTATSTILNAAETLEWMKKHELDDIILVTANYHMPRSLQEFRQAMPDIKIQPAPMLAEGFIAPAWWQDTISTRLTISEYNKFLGSRLRYWVLH